MTLDQFNRRLRRNPELKFLFFLGVFILGMLVGEVAFGQIEAVRPADFRYYVTITTTAGTDTVASRSLEYKAWQDAVNFKQQYPNAIITVEPTGIEIRGTLPTITEIITIYEPDTSAAPADTVYVPAPADTVYIPQEVKQYDQAYNMSGQVWHPTVSDMNLEIRQAIGDTTGTYRMAIDGTTTASRVSVATNCYGPDPTGTLINERTSGSMTADSTGAVFWQSNPLDCRGIMTYWITERDSSKYMSVWFADIGQILALD